MTETTIKHHLTDTIMMAYSTGALPEAYSLVVACHVSFCSECRCALEGFDALGGAVLEQTRKSELSEGALSATLDLIANTPAVETPKKYAPSDFPAPLQEYVGGGSNRVQWRKIGGGMKQAILPIEGETNARLLYIPAGMAVPDHSHNGPEMTMVLQGAFSDEVDRFARGDVEFGDEDLSHKPVADAGQDCICLVATDAPLKFKGLIPRMLQLFINI
ncbi:MAG: ChrR family anti-sigma-E factor [Proteobacteria bacterium]|nr:ChrR family anti-sigma-E factor [Pseudomonadota bacterium]